MSRWPERALQHHSSHPPEATHQRTAQITLRYDLRTGEVSLHEGGIPLSSPFCSGKLPPGTRFNGIRLGASAGAALAVDALHIRAVYLSPNSYRLQPHRASPAHHQEQFDGRRPH